LEDLKMVRNAITKNWAEVAVAILVALTTGIYFSTQFTDFTARPLRKSDLEALKAADTFRNQANNLATQNERISKLLEELSTLPKSPTTSSRLVAQLSLLKSDLHATNEQVTALRSNIDLLNKSLESSPERALTIPLLKKDLEDFKTSSQHDTDSLRAEMLRGYDLNKWLIGLMLAAIIGVIINNAMQPRFTQHKPHFE
jgi:hypothetical protein